MAIFQDLTFNVNRDVFYHIFENPDNGFGFTCLIRKDKLSELQVDTLAFLALCHSKKQLGTITIHFVLDGAGDINKITRRVEKVSDEDHGFELSATY